MGRPVLAVLVLVGGGCSEEPGIQRPNCFLPIPEVPSENCSPADEKRFVDGVMRRHHLFNDQLPELDRSQFETADALLRALVEDVVPPDRFSFIASKSGEVQFYEEGKVLGLGLSLRFVDDELFLSQVYGSQAREPESPASRVGLRRGDRVVSVGGRTIEDLVEAGELDGAFGPNVPGEEVELTVETRDGSSRSVTVVRDFFVFEPVPVIEIFREDEVTIGYLVLRSFVEPAVPSLQEAFDRFRSAPIDAVILDLRYNSGGLLGVARRLSELVVGRTSANEIIFQRVFNEDNASCLETDRLTARPQSLDRVDRVVAITLEGTASASEQVISGLGPHVETWTVGDTTFGKPVGQLGFPFCEDRVLRPVTFRTVNANGEGDYFGGIVPDCPVAERVDAELGDPAEAMLAVALARASRLVCDPSKRRLPRPAPTGTTLRHPDRPPGAELIF